MTTQATSNAPPGALARVLNAIERVGNKLPDPAILFALLLAVVALASWAMSSMQFSEIDPRTSKALEIKNLLSGAALTAFAANLVGTFVNFPPLGVVLVAMLGLGVAEYTGFINAGLRSILAVTPARLLTPVLIAVGILSHVAVDAGYVLVIPLGAVIFYAAGRHPLAGIAAAFAGVSGGFSATFFIPSSLDPLLAGLTQASARLSADPAAAQIVINPLNNFYFTSASAILIVLVGWAITDLLIEPRLKQTQIDGDPAELPKMEALSAVEKKGLLLAAVSILVAGALFALTLLPGDSPWRAASGELAASSAPLMKSIVALIFVFFLIPGVVYGYAAGSVKNSGDVIKGMSKAMSGMGYYIVMAFFCAQFIYAFGQSNLGALLAIKGASWLKEMHFPMGATLIGMIMLTGLVNLLIGSASAKWALIGAIMVPMLMELGLSPDFIQAAYRVGDSSTNIITPLMPYFPLIVVFCQKYVKSSGIGTLLALMLPYSILLMFSWTLFLLGFWALDIPLGIGASYTFPALAK
ncbi:aminobenzoyl-glutamate transporter [Paucibacter sp. KBW04]|uniref:AbgT family transporter n=1 Tax=Paucibacter sp. KBW04 TaxID=2153361 RepID=UPI000F5719BA|nr:AbgT family transporter [Paucibacter sp. KBW04]RQO57928.1 aminobenzoyl-glutamate transporter [Paucibacter sp. KBW04]